MRERSRVAILISGRGSNMAALIYAARAADCAYDVVLVTGDRPDAPGLALAEAEGIAVARPAATDKSQFFEELSKSLEAADVDLIALAGFMRIIPASFLDRWNGRILNIHPSLLPKYKGLGTHESVLQAGETSTGATVHLVTNELDSGEILGQVEVAVLPGDDPDRLAERVLIEAQPDVYYWPKYYGASGWLGVKLNRRDVDWDQIGEWLERSWRACAPPRLTKLMRAADEF